MVARAKLVQELAKLDHADWLAVIEAASQKRREQLKNEVDDEDPQPGISRDLFARWLARRHLLTDPGISRVVYLPANAPDKEVRLLEVNTLVSVPAGARQFVEPLEFTPDLPGIRYTVLVADLTPAQWKVARKNPERILPEGWTLDGAKTFRL